MATGDSVSVSSVTGSSALTMVTVGVSCSSAVTMGVTAGAVGSSWRERFKALRDRNWETRSCSRDEMAGSGRYVQKLTKFKIKAKNNVDFDDVS